MHGIVYPPRIPQGQHRKAEEFDRQHQTGKKLLKKKTAANKIEGLVHLQIVGAVCDESLIFYQSPKSVDIHHGG